MEVLEKRSEFAKRDSRLGCEPRRESAMLIGGETRENSNATFERPVVKKIRQLHAVSLSEAAKISLIICFFLETFHFSVVTNLIGHTLFLFAI